ncbi:MAG: asparagine synthase C-terminal domain-containing protein, partial [Cyanobacteria bacterium J06607_17]
DTPIGDIAAQGYYSVSQAARQAGYPVLLLGMGGDEFFWGYQWVREAMVRNERRLAQPSPSGFSLRRLFRRTRPEQPDFFGVHADLRNGDRWSRQLLPATVSLPDNLWLMQNGLDLSQPLHVAVANLLNRTWLRSNCLALVDRMSMAHSVEVRLPLLDVSLIDQVMGMRNAGLQDWHQPHKHLLVKALQDVLPPETLARKKQGFTPPTQDWMRGIVQRFSPLIDQGNLVQQGLVDARQWQTMADRFNLPFLYKLTLLECWCRIHIQGQTPEALARCQ